MRLHVISVLNRIYTVLIYLNRRIHTSLRSVLIHVIQYLISVLTRIYTVLIYSDRCYIINVLFRIWTFTAGRLIRIVRSTDHVVVPRRFVRPTCQTHRATFTGPGLERKSVSDDLTEFVNIRQKLLLEPVGHYYSIQFTFRYSIDALLIAVNGNQIRYACTCGYITRFTTLGLQTRKVL